MFLKSIHLRDWKAYTTAKFDFPSPRGKKNIVLVGARNGFGKTSLFEAIVLGLFGKDGLPLIARAAFSEVGEERLATNYKSFVEKAINRTAISNGRTSSSVTLVFGLDEEDEEIEIRRVWNFTDSGNFKPNDEEVQIYEGSRRKPVGPRNGDTDRTEWFRDYIAKTFLPYYLAAFFMFDGEQVSAFAEREMSAQVRNGIEGLLGIPVLRELAIDLRKYATAQRGRSPTGSGETLERTERERAELEKQFDESKKRHEELIPRAQNLVTERENLTRELESYGAGSQAQYQEQLTALHRYEAESEKAQEQLNVLLGGEVALALCGKNLRKQLIEQLEGEQTREIWEAGRAQGDRNLTKFLDLLQIKIRKVQPPFVEAQQDLVEEAIKSSWDALWYPPPDNCAEQYLHTGLTASDRQRTIQKLNEIEAVSAMEVMDLLDLIALNDDRASKIKDSITRLEGIAPQLDEKREKMRNLNSEIDAANREIGARKKELDGIEAQLDEKNKTIARLGNQLDQAQPSLRRAARADQVALAIDDIVRQAVPSQIDEIAAQMTRAHKLMSHKKDLVERIDIDEHCNVRLLNKAGVDIRDLDLSAGEKQIFTQALISAVAHVSGRAFPMVIDTPLGRLDVEHRKGVLAHLIERESQVILLSTDTEIVGDYYKLVKPHLLKQYVIKHEQVGGYGNSSPVEGYFQEEAGK